MTYLLQICHPNEIIQHRWKTVDELSEVSMDAIASPTFDWYPGMVVRITDSSIDHDLFVGIYGDTHCVDVSYNSNFLHKNDLNYYQSLIHFWTEGNYVSRMMAIAEPYATPQAKIQSLIKFLHESRRLITDEEHHRAAEQCTAALQQWLLGVLPVRIVDMMRKRLEAFQSRRGNEMFSTRAIVTTALIIAEDDPREDMSGHAAYFTAYAMTALMDKEYSPVVADSIRENIPFYEIAVGIGNSK